MATRRRKRGRGRPRGRGIRFTQRHLDRLPEQGSIADIAAALNVSYDCVYRWVTRDTVASVARNPEGHRMRQMADRLTLTPERLIHREEVVNFLQAAQKLRA